jgi:hypothetical protein
MRNSPRSVLDTWRSSDVPSERTVMVALVMRPWVASWTSPCNAPVGLCEKLRTGKIAMAISNRSGRMIADGLLYDTNGKAAPTNPGEFRASPPSNAPCRWQRCTYRTAYTRLWSTTMSVDIRTLLETLLPYWSALLVCISRRLHWQNLRHHRDRPEMP